MNMTSFLTRAGAALVAVASLFLSACAADGHVVTVQESYAKSAWKNHRIGEAFAKWGFPWIPVVHNPDGTTLYRWVGQARYAYEQQTGHAETAYGGANFYETRIGTGSCVLLITADASGVITNLDTTQEVRGCTDALFSNGLAPTAKNAADGLVLERQIKAIRAIDERFMAACSAPQYSTLFNQSNCKLGVMVYPPNFKMTMADRKLLLAWIKEMNVITDDYKAFFLSSGNNSDASFVSMSTMTQTSAPSASAVSAEKQDEDASMLDDKFPSRLVMAVTHTQMRVTSSASHSRQTYHQLGQ